jgi:hypothetical protein
MRITGYIILLFGFLWLAIWCAGHVGPLTRSIGSDYSKKYPDFASYSGTEVGSAIRSVLSEFQRDLPGVTFPALLMVIGGVLLDIAGRRALAQPMPEFVSLEGPVEMVNGKLTVRIPLDVGGDKLAPFAAGIGAIDGKHLNVTINRRLARRLNIDAGSFVSVDNRRGKFNITRSTGDDSLPQLPDQKIVLP